MNHAIKRAAARLAPLGRRAGLAAIAALLLGAGIGAAPAQAGTYLVYQCATPDGKPSTVSPQWSAWNNYPPAIHAAGIGPVNSCAQGGGLNIQLRDPGLIEAWAVTATAGWSFTAPAGTALTKVDAWRTAFVGSQLSGETGFPFVWIDSTDAPGVTEACGANEGCSVLGDNVSSGAPSNRKIYEPTGQTFTILTGCGGPEGAGCWAPDIQRSYVQLRRATMFLRDDSAPGAGAVTGTLRSAGARSGVERLQFTAADSGSGVYLAELEVDGERAVSMTPDGNAGRCAEANFDAAVRFEFRDAVPCPGSAEVSLELDTRTLANGEHLVEAFVYDASGNRTRVSQDKVLIDNPADVQSLPGALVLDKRTKNPLRTAYAKKRTITGVLHRAGTTTPLAGVRLAVSTRLEATGAPWAAIEPPVITSADGRFALSVPTTASRTVRIAATGTQVDVAVKVSAKLTARAARSSIRLGGKLRLSGQLQLEGLPSGGASIEIQSRYNGRWRTIDTTRTKAKGRWTWSYRVQRSRGALPFRARLVKAGDVPASGGTSRVVRVRVR